MFDTMLVGIAAATALIAAYAVGTVRLHLKDEEQIRDTGRILFSPFPASHRLTRGGKIRATIGKIALGIFILNMAGIGVRFLLARL